MGFRGMGNIFWGGSVFEKIVGWREIRTEVIQSVTDGSFCRRQKKWYLDWSSKDGIKEKKGVAYPNILWMMSESFSQDGVLDSCVIWWSETNLEKVRCLYIGSHEGSWLNWKETRRGFDQVKHISSRAYKPMVMGTET